MTLYYVLGLRQQQNAKVSLYAESSIFVPSHSTHCHSSSLVPFRLLDVAFLILFHFYSKSQPMSQRAALNVQNLYR